MVNNLQQMHLTLVQKKVIQETAEATADFIGNKIAKRIAKVPKYLSQNNSETITNEHSKNIPKEWQKKSSEKIRKVSDDLMIN